MSAAFRSCRDVRSVRVFVQKVQGDDRRIRKVGHCLHERAADADALLYGGHQRRCLPSSSRAACCWQENGVTPEYLLNLLFYIIITPVISLTLTKIMYMSENKMIVADALSPHRLRAGRGACTISEKPQHPKDSSIALHDVRFSYDGRTDVIRGVSVDIRPGQTVALVGPSGGGKSTLASLICRFFDVGSGSICVGGADVRDIPKEELMDTVSFVFQNSRLLKGSILDNVKLGRPDATEAEALSALRAAQCMDIIEKFPDGIRTVIGSKGVSLLPVASGGALPLRAPC